MALQANGISHREGRSELDRQHGYRAGPLRNPGRGRPGIRPRGRNQHHSIPAAGPLLYATNYALGTPGNAASYKVYVILTTGNERGSNSVTISPFPA